MPASREFSLDDPPLQHISWFIPACCLFFGAIFAALSETLSATGEIRLRAVKESNRPERKVAEWLMVHRERVAATLLLGRVVCVALGAWWLTKTFMISRPELALAAVCVYSLVFASLAEVGFAFAQVRIQRTTLSLFRLLQPLLWMLWPIVLPLTMLAKLVKRIAPKPNDEDPARLAHLEVEHLIEQSEEQGVISEDQAHLLLSALEFKDTVTKEVMVPRTRMVAIEVNTPPEEVLSLIMNKGHSRYPVYRERIDQVEGILYAKDLFRVIKAKNLSEVKLSDIIRRAPFFVAESQKISQLLREMQSRRIHLALVVDEYGGTSGIVTLEDIIEEIVGEIRDEHDFDEALVQKLGQDTFLVNASISLSDLHENLQDNLGDLLPPFDDTVESLGGMLVKKMGKVPAIGETIELEGLTFKVTEADQRHIKRVELKNAAPKAVEENDAAE